MSKYSAIKSMALWANQQLPKKGLVISTFGNVSVCDRTARIFAIKPSGVAYEELTAEKMVVVDFEARVVEGDLRPSSDTRTHAVLYKNWKSIGSIVHTHSTYATAWAQALRDIPILGTTHADHLTIDIPCAPPMSDKMIKGDYEEQTGFQITEYFRKKELKHEDVEMMLVGSHAPFAWGKDAAKALYNAEVLEEIAKMAFISLQINPRSSRLKASLIKKHFERKHGPDSYYGQK